LSSLLQVQAWYKQKGFTIHHKNAQKGFLVVSPKAQAGASAAESTGVTPLEVPASGVQYALPFNPDKRITRPSAAAAPAATNPANSVSAAADASEGVAAAAAAAPAQSGAACPVVLDPMPYTEDQGSCTRGKECTNWGVQALAAAAPEMQAIAAARKDNMLHCLIDGGVDMTHPDLAGMCLNVTKQICELSVLVARTWFHRQVVGFRHFSCLNCLQLHLPRSLQAAAAMAAIMFCTCEAICSSKVPVQLPPLYSAANSC
jgi:hypothetical protein